jgi:hypothetical protein
LFQPGAQFGTKVGRALPRRPDFHKNEQIDVLLCASDMVLTASLRLLPWKNNLVKTNVMMDARNISELCKSLICRHSLKNAGEVVLAVFFIGECDFDSMGVDLSGRNFAKTIAKESGGLLPHREVTPRNEGIWAFVAST